MSPLVRLGTETGSKVVKVAIFTLYSLLLVLGLCRALPPSYLHCKFIDFRLISLSFSSPMLSSHYRLRSTATVVEEDGGGGAR
ncbi:hypothetical protein LOK49_LG10G00496 [Camellia lanceoleosa]|uniref:Uncharacterized protein n=1 Tax=Camellia lanceoleosa TaxID=1840588 RepID=A0ACC0GBV4_9ERIC|nr:hypothetical protein LOK49_LG10G00496 [Camellia lanceoleosa]